MRQLHTITLAAILALGVTPITVSGQSVTGNDLLERCDIWDNFTDMEPSHMLVENTQDNIKITKNTDKELIHMPMEINILENGKKQNMMDKEYTHMLTATNTLVNGKKE